MNELPLSLFALFVVIQALATFYTVLTLKSDFPHIFSAAIAAFVGYINANMILNGNVVLIAATTTATTYIPIQSMPVHYILLGFAVCMALITGYLVLDWVHNIFTSQKEDTFSFEGFNE